ncbi:Tat pathway signal sequence domain protein [Streptomyces fragilis]|uniref:Tat pathway signal sequence domain protein n=1 Tax=Streptomyces fragilis TaxID=67301 RepID=A0ABV2YMR8_9ACTN|nr:Tat pathway signal sequence domain protein [Streptomyces fragilis]
MRNRRTALLATAALAGVASLGASTTAVAAPAAATSVLTYDATGANVPVGAKLTASLAAGTTAKLTTTAGGSTGVTCTGSAIEAIVATNPTAPGTATENNVKQTFDAATCTSNIPLTTGVASITVTPLLTAAVTSGGALTVNGPITATAVLKTPFGNVTCVYNKSSISGTTNNADDSINFSNQLFTKTSGSTTCPSNSYFTAKYAPVTGPGGAVSVN